ncbi:MAG: Ger(x)C family spore germination protein [Eubacteriales bacterium]|jgi:spore germination protein KC
MKSRWANRAAALALAGVMTLCTGCQEAREVNDLVFPLFLGVDQGEGDNLLLTVKFPTYTGSGGSAPTSGGEEDPFDQGDSNVYTIQCPTMVEGIGMLSRLMPKQVSLTHVEFLCIGEELARGGVSRYIMPLQRDEDSSNIMQVLVTQGQAKEFIMEHSAKMSGNYTREASLIVQSGSDAGTRSLRFGEFYNQLYATYMDPVTLYGGVMKEENQTLPFWQRDGMWNELGTGMTPAHLNVEGPQKSLVTGLAVFQGDRMVGMMDSYEQCLYDLIQEGTVEELSFEDPQQEGRYLALLLGPDRPTRRKGWVEDGVCHVKLEVFLEGDVQEGQVETFYESRQHIEELDEYIEGILQHDMERLLELAQQQWKADIFGLGRLFIGGCSTVDEWEAFDWFSRYPQCEVELKVHYTTRRGSILYQEDEDQSEMDLQKFEERR